MAGGGRLRCGGAAWDTRSADDEAAMAGCISSYRALRMWRC